MSSTPESAADGQPRENSSGDAGSRPAPNSPEAAAADAMNANSGSDASASDPTPSAIRTSLAQRFATARSTAGSASCREIVIISDVGNKLTLRVIQLEDSVNIERHTIDH